MLGACDMKVHQQAIKSMALIDEPSPSLITASTDGNIQKYNLATNDRYGSFYTFNLNRNPSPKVLTLA